MITGAEPARRQRDLVIPSRIGGVPVIGIEEGAFRGVFDLCRLTFPGDSGVLAIDDLAFEGCTSLMTVVFPPKLECIGLQSFNGCRSLAAVNLPRTVRSVGANAFSGCDSVTDVTGHAIAVAIVQVQLRSPRVAILREYHPS